MTIGLILAAVVGLSLGLLGGGGSVLAVPIFVYLLGYDAKVAIAMSLAVVGVTSLVASVGHWRAGNVRLKVAAAFAPVAMLGTWVGARLATLVSGTFQLSLFAVVMLTSAVFMFRGSSRQMEEAAEGECCRIAPAAITAQALFVGVMTGFVGVGGGFLIVPALALLSKVPIRIAIGTSLVVIALNAAVGFAGYLGEVEVPWLFMGAFAAVATVGATGGSRLGRFVPQHALRRAFAVFLVAMGTLILFENRASLLPGHAVAGPTTHTTTTLQGR